MVVQGCVVKEGDAGDAGDAGDDDEREGRWSEKGKEKRARVIIMEGRKMDGQKSSQGGIETVREISIVRY